MKVAERIQRRIPAWRELAGLCDQLDSRSRSRKMTAPQRTEFARLYRAACADLALAEANQLPSDTVRYLHLLVGRAHNLLYRTRGLEPGAWRRELFGRVPARLFRDNYLRVAMGIFWGGFIASAYLATDGSPVPDFASRVVGREQLVQYEQNFADLGSGSTDIQLQTLMVGFYLQHNATIGLRCFVMGLAFGVGGLFETLLNAVVLGAVFGHMAMTPQSDNFFQFVTAHGPFELTAIVLSAAAGMRLGFSMVDTGGLGRGESLRLAGRQAAPTMLAAVLLFFGAALIEGFLSPSAAPYEVKAIVSVLCTALLMWYFVVLGLAEQPDELDEER